MKTKGKPTVQPAIDRPAMLARVFDGASRQPRPEAQLTLIFALVAAMGGLRGAQPDLPALAARLGVSHQTLYRTLRVLETKGLVVRVRRGIEIRLTEVNHGE